MDRSGFNQYKLLYCTKYELGVIGIRKLSMDTPSFTRKLYCSK